jgi:hypothetical protein
MRIIAGILLIAVSFIGALFFRSYNGSKIPNPGLWFIFFILLGLSGLWLISSSLKKTMRMLSRMKNTELEKIKANSERIVIEFDLCEFRSGSYLHQVEDENMNSIGWAAPGSVALFADKTIMENVNQSSLIYNYSDSGKIEKFISQSFPIDETTLKYHVLNHSITLYIDRFDRKRYFFELKR